MSAIHGRKIDYQILVGYLLLFSGSLLAIWIFFSLVTGIRTYWWDNNVAIIYESKILLTTSNPLDKLKTFHKVQIRYRYQVDGKSHESKRIYQTDIPLLGLDQAQQIIDQYPTGSVQTDFYNPASPQEAVLVQGIATTQLLMIAPILLFLVIGYRLVTKDH